MKQFTLFPGHPKISSMETNASYKNTWLGKVAHDCNLSTWEGEARK